MSRGRTGSPMLIGLFVLGAAALAVAAVIVFGSGRFFRKELKLVSYFRGDVNGLSLGAPVKFRGVRIGSVEAIKFRLPPPATESPADLPIPVWYTIDLDTVSEFGGGAPRIGPERIEELIAAGLRARLETESFVTGVLYVGLNYYPGSPVVTEGPGDTAAVEIPTVPTAVQQALQTLDKVVRRVDALDLEGLVASARDAFDGVGKLARSPEIEQALAAARDALASVRRVADSLEPGVRPTIENLDAAVVQARKSLVALDQALERLEPDVDRTFESVTALIHPNAPLTVELMSTLEEIREAARSLRNLATDLERNPNSLLTGRPRP